MLIFYLLQIKAEDDLIVKKVDEEAPVSINKWLI